MKLIYGEYDYFNQITWAVVQANDGSIHLITDKFKDLYDVVKIEARYLKIAMEYINGDM